MTAIETESDRKTQKRNGSQDMPFPDEQNTYIKVLPD